MGGVVNLKDIVEVFVMFVMNCCFWFNGVDIFVDCGYLVGMESGWIDFE